MHDTLAARCAHWVVRHEAWLVFLAGTLAFLAIPLTLGRLGISWDAVNHHFYLGWIADHPRFDRDYLAAAYQSYQFPYLYWPVYKLAMAGASGTVAGMVLGLLHATAIPAVWMIARCCIPGEDLFAAGMRATGVLLAFLSGAVLSMLETTSNDLLAATPMLWAYALALRPIAFTGTQSVRWSMASGVLAGISVAFKLSNGFLAVALPVLWFWPAGSLRPRIVRALLAGACLLAGFVAAYGYWGWQLWVNYGSPIYPLYDASFAPVREALGWKR